MAIGDIFLGKGRWWSVPPEAVIERYDRTGTLQASYIDPNGFGYDHGATTDDGLTVFAAGYIAGTPPIPRIFKFDAETLGTPTEFVGTNFNTQRTLNLKVRGGLLYCGQHDISSNSMFLQQFDFDGDELNSWTVGGITAYNSEAAYDVVDDQVFYAAQDFGTGDIHVEKATLNPNGTLGPVSVVSDPLPGETQAYDLAVFLDGKILVALYYTHYLFDSSGVLSKTFFQNETGHLSVSIDGAVDETRYLSLPANTDIYEGQDGAVNLMDIDLADGSNVDQPLFQITASGSGRRSSVWVRRFAACIPPANDNWIDAQVLPGDSGFATGTTVCASLEEAEPQCSDTTLLEGSMFGAHVQGSGFTEDSWEDTRKQCAIIRTFNSGEWAAPAPGSHTMLALDAGRTVLTSHKAPGGNNAGLQSIIAGFEDATINDMIATYSPYGYRVVFIFWHEPHNDDLDPDDYVAAFRYISDRMQAAGILVGYCAVGSNATAGTPDGSGDLYYPGDEYIDVECHDAYTWGWYASSGLDPRANFDDESFESQWTDINAMVIARGHPLVIGEMGCYPFYTVHSSGPLAGKTTPPGTVTRTQWFTAAANWIKTQENIRGFCLFESEHLSENGNLHDWRTSATELTAFINDSYFSGTEQLGIVAQSESCPDSTVWYAFTPTKTGEATFFIDAYTQIINLEIFTGTSLANLTGPLVAYEGNNPSIPIILDVIQNITYWIRVYNGD